eukprot:gene5585-6274_t
MNEENLRLSGRIISAPYAAQAIDERRLLENKVKLLLEQRKLPATGWDDLSIEHFLYDLAKMDSNNFSGNVGAGEREARIASKLVAKRHYHLGHGIGRSGDISEVQPKAAGSSLISKLTTSFVMDILKIAGAQHVKQCIVVPVATGMALVLTMLALKAQRPKAKYVIWPRIDQKSCFKSILTAGFEPVIIENILEVDELTTNVNEIRTRITDIGAENILCVMSTTSCFAPRVPDKLEEIAVLCKEHEVPHIVNNAYGIQSSKCMHLIEQAFRVGRLDAFIQSTDKNFLVPVGGSVIAGYDKTFIEHVSKTYPGRASGSPIVDLFITLLSLGVNGYKKLLSERKEMYTFLTDGLKDTMARYDERLLDIKHNQISLAVSLDKLIPVHESPMQATELGSMLFKRSVSGTRVVAPGCIKVIDGYKFINWGSHSNNYPHVYMTVAAAIGITKEEIVVFLKRLDKTLSKFKRHNLADIGSKVVDCELESKPTSP